MHGNPCKLIIHLLILEMQGKVFSVIRAVPTFTHYISKLLAPQVWLLCREAASKAPDTKPLHTRFKDFINISFSYWRPVGEKKDSFYSRQRSEPSALRIICPLPPTKQTLEHFQTCNSRLNKEAPTLPINNPRSSFCQQSRAPRHKGKPSNLRALFPAQTSFWHRWRCAQQPGAELEWQSSLCSMTGVVFCCRPSFC